MILRSRDKSSPGRDCAQLPQPHNVFNAPAAGFLGCTHAHSSEFRQPPRALTRNCAARCLALAFWSVGPAPSEPAAGLGSAPCQASRCESLTSRTSVMRSGSTLHIVTGVLNLWTSLTPLLSAGESFGNPFGGCEEIGVDSPSTDGRALCCCAFRDPQMVVDGEWARVRSGSLPARLEWRFGLEESAHRNESGRTGRQGENRAHGQAGLRRVPKPESARLSRHPRRRAILRAHHAVREEAEGLDHAALRDVDGSDHAGAFQDASCGDSSRRSEALDVLAPS
jgi:hypothetical protein